MKIVVNRCYGGFGLSAKAVWELVKLKSDAVRKANEDWKSEIKDFTEEIEDGIFGHKWDSGLVYDKKGKQIYQDREHDLDNFRVHPDVIAVVKKLSKAANGSHAKLEVVEIPDGIEYKIDDYDGIETIHEQHRSW